MDRVLGTNFWYVVKLGKYVDAIIIEIGRVLWGHPRYVVQLQIDAVVDAVISEMGTFDTFDKCRK